MTKPPIYLLDGSGFIYRAYYSRPALLATDNTPANAVVGFIEMMGHMMKYAERAYFGLMFDTRAPTWRHKRFPDYKANREAKPQDLTVQFIPIMRAADALSIPRIEVEGYEADDLLATYTRLAVERGHKVVIVTGDKDMMQLVDDDLGVVMFDPMKRVMIDENAVIKKWRVGPKKIGDVLALGGDQSDGIPGVPLIGAKIAADLIIKYGDLDGVIDHAEELTPARKANLIACAEKVRLYRELVTLREDAPTPVPFEWLKPVTPDPVKIQRFLAWLGMSDVPESLRRYV